MTPSNANTSGLEVVAWSSDEYLADTRARKHGAYWMWGNPASSASVALVTAASAQAAIDAEKAKVAGQDRRIKALEKLGGEQSLRVMEQATRAKDAEVRATAAEARANRLEKALERIGKMSERPHEPGEPYQAARAALQQETQP